MPTPGAKIREDSGTNDLTTLNIARTPDDIVEYTMTTTHDGTPTTTPEGDVVTSARARTTALHTPGAVDASWVGRFAHLRSSPEIANVPL
jgi:hypothetical protein